MTSKATVVCGEEHIDWWLLFYAMLVVAMRSRQRNQLHLELGVSTFLYIGGRFECSDASMRQISMIKLVTSWYARAS